MDEDRDVKNEFMFKIALRARELGNMKMDALRLTAGYDCSTEHEARQANKYMSRGELIEKILVEEFYIDIV